MNTLINDGGPAYPVWDSWRDHGEKHVVEADKGMTLRDWFAGQALAGDMANSSEGCFANEAQQKYLENRATLIWRIADAMIAARNQTKP